MALDILSVAATSVGAESLFSRAKKTLTPQRTRLDPSALEAIECLKHSWRQTLPDYAAANDEESEESEDEFLLQFSVFDADEQHAKMLDTLEETGRYDSS